LIQATMLGDSDDPDRGDARPLAHRIGWMIALWGMSVAVVALVAYALRAWLRV